MTVANSVGEHLLELAFAELLGGLLAERVLVAAGTLAPVVEKRLEGALACAVA